MPAIPPTTPPTTIGVEGDVPAPDEPPAGPAPAVLVDELLLVAPGPLPIPAPPGTVGVGEFEESYDSVDDVKDDNEVKKSEDSESDVLLSEDDEMSEVEDV
jgi:hypothetical protein